jgi:hypothetical protein
LLAGTKYLSPWYYKGIARATMSKLIICEFLITGSMSSIWSLTTPTGSNQAKFVHGLQHHWIGEITLKADMIIMPDDWVHP